MPSCRTGGRCFAAVGWIAANRCPYSCRSGGGSAIFRRSPASNRRTGHSVLCYSRCSTTHMRYSICAVRDGPCRSKRWVSPRLFTTTDTGRRWNLRCPTLLERRTLPQGFTGTGVRRAFCAGHGGCPRHHSRSAGSGSAGGLLAGFQIMRGSNWRPECSILRSGSMVCRHFGGLVIHTASPYKGGSIGPDAAGPPCLRGNRTAPCPMRMDCRSLAALTLSSWLLRSGYMTTALGCFIHIGHAVLHSLIGNKYSGLSRSKTGVCLCSCLLTCAGRSRRSASTTRATARRRRRRRCARIGAWFRGTSARAATLSAFAANRMSGGLCNGASDALDNCISYHAGKSAAKPVSGKGGV